MPISASEEDIKELTTHNSVVEKQLNWKGPETRMYFILFITIIYI